MRRAIFLDRDGVINVNKGFVHRPEDLEWMPGAIEGMLRFSQAGFELIVVTNQSGIARGFFSESKYLEFQGLVESRLAAQGVLISRTYYCPHHPQGELVQYKKVCSCRKPEPGMLLRAKQDFNLQLKNSFLFGDSASDMTAAQRAGVGRYFLIRPGGECSGCYETFSSVFDAATFLLPITRCS